MTKEQADILDKAHRAAMHELLNAIGVIGVRVRIDIKQSDGGEDLHSECTCGDVSDLGD